MQPTAKIVMSKYRFALSVVKHRYLPWIRCTGAGETFGRCVDDFATAILCASSPVIGLMSVFALLGFGEELRVLHGGVEGAAQRLDALTRHSGVGDDSGREIAVSADMNSSTWRSRRSWQAPA